MRGKILEYDKQTDIGLISGQDGVRYNFKRLNMRGEYLPIKGMEVDFEPSEGIATDIMQILKTHKSGVSRAVYIILALLFGLLGAHNFYAGRNLIAFIQLVCALVIGPFTGFLLTIGVAFWVLVEILAISTDGQGRPMT